MATEKLIQAFLQDDTNAQYNPLYLYGESRSVTDAFQGIEEAYRSRHPLHTICRVNTQDFLNDLVQEVLTGQMFFIHPRYADCDLLLFENTQELGGKAMGMEKLYSLFDYLLEHGKKVVIGADRPPAAIAHLEQRNLTQFLGGLVWSIDEQPANEP